MSLIPSVGASRFESDWGAGVLVAKQDQQIVIEFQCVKWSVQLWWNQ